MSALLPIVRIFASTLAATVAIELALAVVLFGVRSSREMLVVALAQVVTNPSVELLCLLVGWHASLPLASLPWVAMAAAELMAVVVEALLYRTADVGRNPWAMSMALNGLSFGLGLLLLG